MTNRDDTSVDQIDPEDNTLKATNIDDTPIRHTDPESIQMNITDDELPTLTNTNNALMGHFDSKGELLPLMNVVQSTIEHFVSNETHPIITENTTKTSPRIEFEDSFDEFKMPNVPEPRPPEIPLKESTDLAELRKFILKIESDIDMHEESLPSEKNIKTLDEPVNNSSEQLDTPNSIEDILRTSPSTSISEFTREDMISAWARQLASSGDEPPINDINETKLIEEKRFSIVNCHSIPLRTKISYMNCSSTYIYICTDDRKIFYAKLNIDDINLPLKWQQHSDLAERLAVSVSNLIVWRFFNNRLYSSNDPKKFPPIGSQWNEIKIDNKLSLLSMSINDQCGW
jgi:hypothetical protein